MELAASGQAAVAHLTDPFGVPPDFMAGPLSRSTRSASAAGGEAWTVVLPWVSTRPDQAQVARALPEAEPIPNIWP